MHRSVGPEFKDRNSPLGLYQLFPDCRGSYFSQLSRVRANASALIRTAFLIDYDKISRSGVGRFVYFLSIENSDQAMSWQSVLSLNRP